MFPALGTRKLYQHIHHTAPGRFCQVGPFPLLLSREYVLAKCRAIMSAHWLQEMGASATETARKIAADYQENVGWRTNRPKCGLLHEGDCRMISV